LHAKIALLALIVITQLGVANFAMNCAKHALLSNNVQAASLALSFYSTNAYQSAIFLILKMMSTTYALSNAIQTILLKSLMMIENALQFALLLFEADHKLKNAFLNVQELVFWTTKIGYAYFATHHA